jgi:hypothetical protein
LPKTPAAKFRSLNPKHLPQNSADRILNTCRKVPQPES